MCGHGNLPVRVLPESRIVMTGSITSIRRDEIPATGVQFEFLWDATLLEQLVEQGRPEVGSRPQSPFAELAKLKKKA